MTAAVDRLKQLNAGFRSKYLTWEELDAQLRSWAEAFPELLRLESQGKSGEGRDLWLVTVGPEPERLRPAAWVDGNMHASEVAGTSAVLAIVEDLLTLHLDPEATLHQLPPHVCDRLRGILLYAMPRISPDGAEAVLSTGRWVRSVPRDDRPQKQHPRWIAKDMNGDGHALLMRRQDPLGDYVEHPSFPGLLQTRQLEDAGPYYSVYPEGEVENYDGENIPHWDIISDNSPDLNRNFPWDWRPDHEQLGGGSYPGSEPESRAVLEATSARPHMFAWLNFHTFGGVFIRPLGDKPDVKMDPADLAVFQQVEAWNTEHTGYPTVSLFEEFLYEPEKPLRGDMAEYAYYQRGCIGYVCEIWDLFQQLGIERKKRFVDYYSKLTKEEATKLVSWDREHNQGRIFREWKKLEHPQLGEVEVGGLLGLVGVWNPPYELLEGVLAGQSAAFLRVAALLPRVLTKLETRALDGGLSEITLEVSNDGYLGTYGLSSARKQLWNEPLYAELSGTSTSGASTSGTSTSGASTSGTSTSGASTSGASASGASTSSTSTSSTSTSNLELVAPSAARQEVGHLDGWGRGPYQNIAFPRSQGSSNRKRLRWIVSGKGTAQLRVGSCRVGFHDLSIDVG